MALERILQNLCGKGRGRVTTEVVPEIEAFCCLLAKIAYSYAVATQGLFPREETPLIELMKRNGENAGHWIGSSDIGSERSESNQHVVGIGVVASDPSEFLARCPPVRERGRNVV